MSPDQISALACCMTFAAFTAHVTLDNALAAVRWVRNSRTSGTNR